MRTLCCVLVCAACSPIEPADDSAPDAQLTVVIGTGSDTFKPLSPMDPLTMVHGPQGGWHLLGAVHIDQLEGEAEVHFTVRTAEEVLVADNTYVVGLRPDGEGGGEFTGMYAYLTVTELASGEANTPPELLADEPLTLRMEVQAPNGRSGEAELVIVAALDPADE